MPAPYVLTLACPDRPGIVAEVATHLFSGGANITDSQQYGDAGTGRFFMRVEFDTDDDPRSGFAEVAERFDMAWQLVTAGVPLRTLILVSREGHCLNDLLFRQSTGALDTTVPAVVSNHRDLEHLAAAHDVDFVHVPVGAGGRQQAEQRLLRLVRELDIELVVLARYMQILSDDLCRALAGRVINIHHSFLPSFKGARPYHQAHERGVKLIGATAHYVTADLDEGPIIEQDVARVSHRSSPADLVRVGQDVESLVLSRAVRWHAQHRVLLNGSRTVVFP